jgi:hypothetical protein
MKKATPQLRAITIKRGFERKSFRCPYQAYVMKRLEMATRKMGANRMEPPE